MANILTPKEAYTLIRQGLLKTAFDGHVSEHFQWREVFANCTLGEVAGCPQLYYENALIQSKLMEKIRAHFGGKPISVHCWYRDVNHNLRVGGAKNSRHLRALATDFHIQGHEGAWGNAYVQHELDKQPFMKNAGLEFTHGGWTHADSGGYSRFEY